MDEIYTPTTERVRLAYRQWAFLTDTDEADAQFDRWLASIQADSYLSGQLGH